MALSVVMATASSLASDVMVKMIVQTTQMSSDVSIVLICANHIIMLESR